MAADRPYGEFYDFYSVSPGYFGHILVLVGAQLKSKLQHSGTLNVSSMNARPPVIARPYSFATFSLHFCSCEERV
jgi:hypothetical protein